MNITDVDDKINARAARDYPELPLNEAIGKLTEKKSTETWVRELNEAGVPCGPIYSIDQAFGDPQVKNLGMVQKVGDVPYLGQPVTLSRTPSKVVSHPPKQGEHTAPILAEIGYSAAAVEELRKKGIV